MATTSSPNGPRKRQFTPAYSADRAPTSPTKCVCEICICGKHRCPKGVHSGKPYGNISSNYRDAFGWKVCPVHIHRPEPAVPIQNAPFEGESLSRSDYKQWPTAIRQPAVPLNSTLGNIKHPFQGTTTSASAFTAHPYCASKTVKPDSVVLAKNGPFQGESSMRSDFVAFPDHRPRPAFKPPNFSSSITLSRGTDGRDFQTEKGVNFNDKGYAKRESFKPFQSNVLNSAPFEGTSNTRASYRNWGNVKPREPFRPQLFTSTTKTAGEEDRAFNSESRDQYKGLQGEYIPPVKPQASVALDNGPFQGTTTSQAAFTPFPGAKPSERFVPDHSSHRPSENRTFTTESSQNFVPHGYAARKSYKDPQTISSQAAPFEGESSMRSDFVAFPDHRPRPAFKPPNFSSSITLSRGTDGRDFQTEKGVNFNDKGYAKRRSFKPMQDVFHDHKDTRSFVSESQSSYTPKTAQMDPVCPSENLPHRKNASLLNPDGHLRYEQDTNKGIWKLSKR